MFTLRITINTGFRCKRITFDATFKLKGGFVLRQIKDEWIHFCASNLKVFQSAYLFDHMEIHAVKLCRNDKVVFCMRQNLTFNDAWHLNRLFATAHKLEIPVEPNLCAINILPIYSDLIQNLKQTKLAEFATIIIKFLYGDRFLAKLIRSYSGPLGFKYVGKNYRQRIHGQLTTYVKALERLQTFPSCLKTIRSKKWLRDLVSKLAKTVGLMLNFYKFQARASKNTLVISTDMIPDVVLRLITVIKRGKRQKVGKYFCKPVTHKAALEMWKPSKIPLRIACQMNRLLDAPKSQEWIDNTFS